MLSSSRKVDFKKFLKSKSFSFNETSAEQCQERFIIEGGRGRGKLLISIET